ncbi:hypothetical protein HanPSC8_Chr14g0620161 [Helianthus annuus]|nr:hypothetical protein HanPSC8_Chr14g0620161 [Helianthus annuus]
MSYAFCNLLCYFYKPRYQKKNWEPPKNQQTISSIHSETIQPSGDPIIQTLAGVRGERALVAGGGSKRASVGSILVYKVSILVYSETISLSRLFDTKVRYT